MPGPPPALQAGGGAASRNGRDLGAARVAHRGQPRQADRGSATWGTASLVTVVRSPVRVIRSLLRPASAVLVPAGVAAGDHEAHGDEAREPDRPGQEMQRSVPADLVRTPGSGPGREPVCRVGAEDARADQRNAVSRRAAGEPSRPRRQARPRRGGRRSRRPPSPRRQDQVDRLDPADVPEGKQAPLVAGEAATPPGSAPGPGRRRRRTAPGRDNQSRLRVAFPLAGHPCSRGRPDGVPGRWGWWSWVPLPSIALSRTRRYSTMTSPGLSSTMNREQAEGGRRCRAGP